ncbi:MAG: LysR family transcriptional regulator [Erysipelotrichaceae bacterium]|nr:LysR family transcriptional regulator [Erysipelotrichaceae bacterium]
MDLRNLNTFIQTAELSSFTRAAEKLGYSQPTISFQIKQLEQELGVQLFERIGHTVSLTQKGREILSYAQRIVQLSDEMSNSGKTEDIPADTLHIGMAESLCQMLIIDEFSTFRQNYPQLSLCVTTASTEDLLKLLDHNEVDLICTMDHHLYDINYQIISEEKIPAHFICSVSHPLAQKQNIDVKELLNEPFMLTEKGMSYRRLMDEQLAKLSLEITPVLEFSNPSQITQLVEQGQGLSFLPDYVTKPFLEKGTICYLDVPEFQIDVWKQIVVHRDKWMSASLKAVLNHLSQIQIYR